MEWEVVALTLSLCRVFSRPFLTLLSISMPSRAGVRAWQEMGRVREMGVWWVLILPYDSPIDTHPSIHIPSSLLLSCIWEKGQDGWSIGETWGDEGSHPPIHLSHIPCPFLFSRAFRNLLIGTGRRDREKRDGEMDECERKEKHSISSRHSIPPISHL